MVSRIRPAAHIPAVVNVQTFQDIPENPYYGQTSITLNTGEVTVIVGPNGVGKSALVEEIGRSLRAQSDVELFSGYRQIYFQTDDVDQVGQSLQAFQAQLGHVQVNRMRNPWGEQHLRSVVRRIINRHYQDTNDIAQVFMNGIDVAKAKAEQAIILEELNGIFEAGRLAVRIILEDGTLKAKRKEHIYGIDRMSDGERAALLLVGAILVRPVNSRISIDEPERHLNPAIAGPLIAAALRVRPDLGYIFSTHDLSLLEWLSPSQIIHVSDSEVIHPEPEMRRYKIDLLRNVVFPSEELRSAVYGSRKALLLVEGTDQSTDEALFGLLYEGWNVIGRGGWESVSAEVKAINNNNDLHWLRIAGIIDGDGRDAHEREQLERSRVFSLPCPTIENLFFLEGVVEVMIELSFNTNGGKSVYERMNSYAGVVISAVEKAKDEIIHRRLVWRANRILSGNKISVDDVRNGKLKIDEIDLDPIRFDITQEVEGAIRSGNPHHIMMRVPIKDTGIPAALCSEIGFPKFPRYKQAVLHHMQSVSPTGTVIIKALKDILPNL